MLQAHTLILKHQQSVAVSQQAEVVCVSFIVKGCGSLECAALYTQKNPLDLACSATLLYSSDVGCSFDFISRLINCFLRLFFLS